MVFIVETNVLVILISQCQLPKKLINNVYKQVVQLFIPISNRICYNLTIVLYMKCNAKGIHTLLGLHLFLSITLQPT